MPLTRHKSSVTILREDLANSWYGGLFGTPQGDALDPEDPLVAGHVHDGLHLDGHAQKIHLDNHVTGQLNGANIIDGSIPCSKLAEGCGGGGGGGEDLAETLVLGNFTGGTDIEITPGDSIVGPSALQDNAPQDGGSIPIKPGSGTAATYPYAVFTINSAPLTAGDFLRFELSGNPFLNRTLTGVSATRTSGGNNFDVRIADTSLMAIEIAEAINDPANNIDTYYRGATAVGNQVIVEYEVIGPIDPIATVSIEYFASTSAPGAITPSTLTSFVDGLAEGKYGAIYASNGDSRGSGAIDLQIVHSLSSQVASAEYSSIIGGSNNRIDNPVYPSYPYHSNGSSSIVGGNSNRITGEMSKASFIAGGMYNSIGLFSSNTYWQDTRCSAILAGYSNRISDFADFCVVGGLGNRIGEGNQAGSDDYRSSAIFGELNRIQTGPTSNFGGSKCSFISGQSNRIDDSPSSVAMGRDCKIYSAPYSFSGGWGSIINGYNSFSWGNSNITGQNADLSSVFGGKAYSYVIGQAAWSSTTASAIDHGGAQRSSYSLMVKTTDATPYILNTVGTGGLSAISSSALKIRPGRAYAFRITVSAYQYGGASGSVADSASWEITGLIKRDLAGNTTLIGSAGAGAPLYNDVAAAGWSISVTANDTIESLQITATGEANKNIVWHASVYTSEAGEDA